jgi:hypothetical protein
MALADDSLADPRPFALTTVTFVVAAILLPVLVRGLRLALDVIAAGVWAGALYAALVGIENLAVAGADTRRAAVGAGAAAVIAVTAAAARRRREEAALSATPVP